MKFAFPILTAKGEEFKDVKVLTELINGEQSGHCLLGNHNKWHGGIHISDKSAPWCKDKYPVRAIADGKVVAFRMMKDYLTSEYQGESLRYSNCFCLVQHEYCEINAETKAKNEFTFYSLYMHLLPWDKYQSAEKLVLKKGWNARNSVPDAEQQRVDAALPRFTLPKDTELEMDSSAPSQKGNVGGKEYDFIKVIIKSKLSNAQIKEAEKAGVLVSEGSSVWIANSPDAVEVIKPNLPTWLFDQIEAELLANMVGRADPVLNGPTGRLMAGDRSVSLPANTKLQYDAHQLEFHWIGDKARKMARCNYVIPNNEGSPGSCGIAWVCVEDEFIKAKTLPPSHLGELYVLPSPVAIAAGETIGYLGLVETPGSLIGGKKSKHQVHLEVFTQDPRLDDVLANKAGTKGGATYAKVPAELVLYEKKKQDGKDLWAATGDKSLEELVESPKLEKDATKQEWVCVSSGKYVKKEQVELLSQHDWLKIGFKKVDGTGSDGYLDPEAPPTFFTKLVKSFDTDSNGELSSEEIQAALQNNSNAGKLHKLIVKHPSEWYEKSSASSYLWLDKLMKKIGLPDFDLLVDHEKQRIDKLEWMQSAAKLKLGKDIWHIYPMAMYGKKKDRFVVHYTKYNYALGKALDKQMAIPSKYAPKVGNNKLASRDEVLLHLTPDDDLTKDSIYQFLDLSKYSEVSDDELNSFLLGQGVLEGKGSIFSSAAKKYNVSEVYLVSHASLETGRGTSNFARGKEFNGTTVYNMYGINVRDDKPSLGTEYAYNNGWDSIDKAIDGGAKWISSNFVNHPKYKQNTLYKMRWNPASPGEHQYASDVLWAKHQIPNMKKRFDVFPNAILHVDIPVYEE
ncbi:N-acetylglucosaminidase [Aeromonas salmonicida]|uniref:N-acetylglucosaminidase n=1 Tax=Aeromonas salmonicida TaxID=645 RepID=UPI0007413E53|nr:N-acetylglucosaminidase [Aeromonas salmonicida]MDE7527239.1 N-acetylglucosaminidase [Aeromonas salmonicida]MDE7531536.1 N-acetylglucosaminidase [Aeromonas salmonicida]